MFDVSLGKAVVQTARFVALWWDARAVPERHDADLNAVLKDVPAVPGVYAVTGRHDARTGQGVLYIGMATDLSTRIISSVRECLSEVHAEGQRTLFSDVWDLTIRWARLSDELTVSVERLLIMSHSPPFNSQAVRRAVPTPLEHDLVVMSAGRKGPLLPVAAGAYQSEGWRNIDGPLAP